MIRKERDLRLFLPKYLDCLIYTERECERDYFFFKSNTGSSALV